MADGKKVGRPKKTDSSARKGELIVYMLPGMLNDFRAAAQQREVSMSTLAGNIIEDYLYGPKTDNISTPTAQEIAFEVVRLLRLQDVHGEINEELFVPPQNEDSKSVYGTDNSAQEITGANLAPQKIDGDKFAPKTPNPIPRAVAMEVNNRKSGADILAPKKNRRRRKAVYRKLGGDGDVT